MAITAEQRIDAILRADFLGNSRGDLTSVCDLIQSGPAMPAIYSPAPVTLPPVPETWRTVQ